MKSKNFIIIGALFLLANQALCQLTHNWTGTIAGTNFNSVKSIQIDDYGNSFIAGVIYGTTDINPGSGVLNVTSAGSSDVYLIKLDATQNVLWYHVFGTTGDDFAIQIELNNNNDIYLVGTHDLPIDLDPGSGNTSSSLPASGNFIAKYSTDGDFLWANGLQINGITGIDVTSADELIVVGSFFSTVDFDPGIGVYNLSSTQASTSDAFVLKLNSNGTFAFALQFNGDNYEHAQDVTVDSGGNIYIVGLFQTTVDFDPSIANYYLTSIGDYDNFIVKLSSAGDFIWAQRYGGVTGDFVESIVFDQNDNLYIAGSFSGTVDLNPEAANNQSFTSNGAGDCYVLKITTNGGFSWAKTFGGSGDEYISDIDFGINSMLYLTGNFSSSFDINPGAGVNSITPIGSDDVFLLELTPAGNYSWSGQLGGSSTVYSQFVNAQNQNHVYLGGYFNGTADFDPNVSVVNHTSMGSYDGFITKLNTCQNFTQEAISSCSNFTWNGTTYSTTGTYTYVTTNAAGCDSTAKLNLIINQPSTSVTNHTGCSSYTWNGTNYTVSGTYTYVTTNAAGCDSTATLNLTVNPMPTLTVTQNGLQLTADEAGASYQWIDCVNGNAPIANATNQSYNATVNGQYAVVVSNGNCSDTSSCITINTVGVNELSKVNAQIYPNPTSGAMTLTSETQKIISLEIKSLTGKIVFSSVEFPTMKLTADLSDQPNGIYFVHLKLDDDSLIVKSVVKQ